MAIVFGPLLAANIVFWVWRQAGSLVSEDPLKQLPSVMLWAWERPEDLSFLDCRQTGVAYLAKTLILDRGGITVRPRFQPLNTPDGCAVVAVVRIEAPPTATLHGRAGEVAQEIAAVADAPAMSVVQVDFDALASQRSFYRQVLERLRERLPDGVRLSITALASWCIHDDWMAGLPVDEAVPMLFQMGVDDQAVRHYLDAGNDFRDGACRFSYGLSTDEPWPRRPDPRRLYAFHPQPWTAAAVARVLEGRE